MSSEEIRAYVLVEIKGGEEKEFFAEVLAKKMAPDFVHGSFDAVIPLRGSMKDVDTKIMEIRKSSHVRRTETLIRSEIFEWEELSGRMKE